MGIVYCDLTLNRYYLFLIILAFMIDSLGQGVSLKMHLGFLLGVGVCLENQ